MITHLPKGNIKVGSGDKLSDSSRPLTSKYANQATREPSDMGYGLEPTAHNSGTLGW